MDNLNVAVVLMMLIAAIVSCNVSADVENKSAQAGGSSVNWRDRFDLVLNLGTLIGVLASLAALLYAARALNLSRKAAQGSFSLQLRALFSEHQEVHLKLRTAKADEWLKPPGGIKENPEWAKVEAYLGLFEHCKYLLEDGLIDEETFRRIYGYRINNILISWRIVKEKLIPLEEKWKDFHQLVKMLGGEVKHGSRIETGTTKRQSRKRRY